MLIDRLIVEAKDRGNPALTETCTVQVQVVDVNDNRPVIPAMEPLVVPESKISIRFQKTQNTQPKVVFDFLYCYMDTLNALNEFFFYPVVDLDLPPGHIVIQVTAADVDLGPSITYSLAQTEEANGSFVIDSYSGIITALKSLDYEEQILHILTVVASDSVHQTEAQITVEVLDVNDNAPVFSQEFYQVGQIFNIKHLSGSVSCCAWLDFLFLKKIFLHVCFLYCNSMINFTVCNIHYTV